MSCPQCSENKISKLKGFICKSNNYLCSVCGLVFIPRSKESLHSYYKEGGYFTSSPNFAYKKALISKSLLTNQAKERIESALSIFPIKLNGKRILDVGCGYGEMLYVFKKKYNCKVQGVEPSVLTSEHGTNLFDAPITPVLLEEFSSNEKFDVVWCSHVLEHTADPNAFLKKAQTLLAPRGLLYVEVPNILHPTGGFSLDMFLYEEHLQTFSSHNLFLILKKHGLSTIGYSDSGFLKFWCARSNIRTVSSPKITSVKILRFLKKYKEEYTIANSIKVYVQKALYAAKLILHKTRDVF